MSLSFGHVYFPHGCSGGGTGYNAGFLLAGFAPVVVLRAASQIVFVLRWAHTGLQSSRRSCVRRFAWGLWPDSGIVHGALEAVVVTLFWFGGATMDGSFVSTVLGLAGGRHCGSQHGGLRHRVVDLAACQPRCPGSRQLSPVRRPSLLIPVENKKAGRKKLPACFFKIPLFSRYKLSIR